MKILYDNQIFKMQKFGGISRYFAELLKGLKDSTGFETLPSGFFSDNAHLQLNKLTYLDNFRVGYRFKGKHSIETLINKREDSQISKALSLGNFDVFHPTYYDASFVQWLPSGKRFVLTVYDMIHERYLDDHYEELHLETIQKRQLIPKADHIIAISQSTKNDIIRYFPQVDEKKISVIHLGSSFSSTGNRSNVDLPLRYILFVGKRGFYKNFLWLLKSLNGFLKQSNTMLVCAGGGEFTAYERTIIEHLEDGQRVKYFPVNNDNDLIAMYKSAACFIFPSIFEGFGIPVLEAFSCNCPVLLPNSSCFPEVAEDGALYYEQGIPDSLIEQLNRILHEPDLVSDLLSKGSQRLQMFSWEKTIAKHKELYEAIATA